MRKKISKTEQRKKDLRRVIKDITAERRILLNEQRRHRIELDDLEAK